jgi:hypothetical protein
MSKAMIILSSLLLCCTAYKALYPILMSILLYCYKQPNSRVSQVDGMIVKVEKLGEEEKGYRRSIFQHMARNFYLVPNNTHLPQPI